MPAPMDIPGLTDEQIYLAIADIAAARGEIYREHDAEYSFDLIGARVVWDAATENMRTQVDAAQQQATRLVTALENAVNYIAAAQPRVASRILRAAHAYYKASIN